MITRINKWLNYSQKFRLPESCLLCKADCYGGFCEQCVQALPFQSHSCSTCALALEDDGKCGRCQRRLPEFDQAWTLFSYRQPITYLIQQLKYKADLAVAASLGKMMANALSQQNRKRPEMIIPVPLSKQRLRQRGFNQALELARPIAKALKLKIDYLCCRRTRDTEPQTELDMKLRKKNMRDAFACKAIPYKHVAIVDDVLTTAATVGELTRSLKHVGVENVEVWVCARAQTRSGPVVKM